jgi:peptidyl-prolyl cis-trans isomerase B (cyclophilin B)
VTKEQERARARRRWEKQQRAMRQRETVRARRMRVAAVVATVAAVVAVLAVLGAVLGSDGDDGDAQAAKDATSSPTSSPVSTTVAGCEQPPKPLGTGAKLSLPDEKTAEGKTYVATVTTNCGDIEVTLDGTKAPQAVAAFVELARKNYWVDAPCHRLTAADTLKVLQCGDPTGTGQGDPGFGFGVENAPADGKYPRGTLAMARTPDPKKGNGGQFFVVYGDSSLPDPDGYTVFGTVTSGLDIVDRIAEAGVAPGGERPDDGVPAAPISILRVAVTEKKA